MTLRITILGSGSATPTLHSHPSAQVLEIGSDLYLIDCGEGTQYRLLEQHFRPGRLKGIFISHLHGDHYFGLFGLLTSLSLAQRTEPLLLFSPRGLNDILTEIFRQSDTRLNYYLNYQEIDTENSSLIHETPGYTVQSLPLRHRIRCTGYLFREKPGQRNLIKEKLTPDIAHSHRRSLKEGKDVYDQNGALLYACDDYTTPPPLPFSYAYCSDTAFWPDLIPQVAGVDCLYHEATFRDDQIEKAEKTCHSTARQAAIVAREAAIGKLLIGHLSSRYTDTELSLQQARSEFPETYFAQEGLTFIIGER